MAVVAAMVACLMPVLVGGTCASTTDDRAAAYEQQFQQEVLDANGPVLVTFYKEGCPTCTVFEPTLDQLKSEYAGRVGFVSIPIMTPYFQIVVPSLQQAYGVVAFPTVVLFVDGQEVGRWVLTYDADTYRAALDAALAP